MREQDIKKYKIRAYLRCGESFFNKGPHNCVCEKCTLVNERTSEKTLLLNRSCYEALDTKLFLQDKQILNTTTID